MARRYSIPGQLVVWVLEGPDDALLRAGLLLLMLCGAIVTTMTAGGAWFVTIPGVVLVAILWRFMRRAQWDYYAALARSGAGDTCPHCGYSLVRLKGEVCPECGVNVSDYIRAVRRHVHSNEPPPE